MIMFPILVITRNNGNELISQFRSSYVPSIDEILIVHNIEYKVLNKHTYIINGNFEIQIIVE